jgi:hypothetical protein
MNLLHFKCHYASPHRFWPRKSAKFFHLARFILSLNVQARFSELLQLRGILLWPT